MGKIQSITDGILESRQKQQSQKPVRKLRSLSEIQGRPYWCGNYFFPFTEEVIQDGHNCCWRHWIGLPKREGVRHPVYHFQEQWIAEFFQYYYFWMEKPPKVGATETYLSLFLYKAATDPKWKGGQVAIIVGTSGLSEAEHMLYRMKEMMKGVEGLDESNYNTRKEFFFNGVHFRAFPAANIDAARSQPNMRAILVDEGAFFPQVDQAQVRSAAEHYIGGAKCYVIWVSTAGATPQGAFYDIGQEPDVKQGGIYRKYIVDYTEGLKPHPQSRTTLYFVEDIEKAKTLATFPRNFLHVWGSGTGDVFDAEAIRRCTRDHSMTPKHGESLLSVDPAFGSSNSGIIGLVRVDGVVYVTEAYELEHPTDIGLAEHVAEKSKHYDRTIVDGHWIGVIRGLQERGVNASGVQYKDKVLKMIARSDEKLREGKVVIKPEHRRLIEQLRSAQKEPNESGKVNKKIMNFDLGDSFIQGVHELFDEGGAAAYQEPD